MRRLWDQWGRPGEPGPCDCGYYVGPGLVTCDDKDRPRCKASVASRMTARARYEHEKRLRAKREFPGDPFPRAGTAMCRWCGEPIVHGRAKSRTRHDGRKDEPNCLGQFFLHKDLHAQRAFLIGRDGKRCAQCGDPPDRLGLEVDHRVPLALVCYLPDDERRPFFGPGNLWLLCAACHKAKTRVDTAMIRDLQRQLAAAGVPG